MHSTFQNLPVELLEAIINRLPSKKDRKSLWSACRRFRELFAARMFETLTIRAKDNALLQLDGRPYTSLVATPPLDCLKLVKHLHLRAPFHQNLDISTRCPHKEDELFDLKGWYLRRRSKRNHVRLSKLILLFSQLQKNSLLSFSWDIGMCIPVHILGPKGYLTKNQSTIESLSLITGTFHMLGTGSYDTVVLSKFSYLRRFAWKGLRSIQEMESLRGLFASNYRTLEDLELDFNEWPALWLDSPFIDPILPYDSEKIVQRFVNLRRLALSGTVLDVYDDTRSVTQAFNIHHLESLKLHNCRGVLEFLSTIVAARLVLKLKSLELIIQDNAIEVDDRLASPLISFLQSFEGLEELYLLLRVQDFGSTHWTRLYWDAIMHHSCTLKKLVYHERVITVVAEEGRYAQWADRQLTEVTRDNEPSDSYPANRDHFYNAGLSKMQLECFGIADHPWRVVSMMDTPLVAQQKFKLLHFRCTGTDPDCSPHDAKPYFENEIKDLIAHNPDSWSYDDLLSRVDEGGKIFCAAFSFFHSPQFSNLQILAFGDFSHSGRYKNRHILLCRAVTPNPDVKFRVMRPDDIARHKQSGLLSLDFLAACPRNSFLAREDDEEFP